MRAKIAIIHPQLGWGGSEPCALWAIEALKQEYDLTLITGGAVSWERLNSFYGTHINATDCSVVVILPPLLLRKVQQFHAIRHYRLARYCRQVSTRFDVLFSIYNPMDFGRPGIQYVLDPLFNNDLLQKVAGHPTGLRGIFYQLSPIRNIYLLLANRLSGVNPKGFNKNTTITDSDWTSRLTERFLGIPTRTVYPPVYTNFPKIPWKDRKDGFVCVGRVTHEKRINRNIEILARVREECPDVHLHVLGKSDGSRYSLTLQKKYDRYSPWITWEGAVSERKKAQLIASHKYGLHGREHEPFGIAVAEMVKAGSIVWAPDGGGQVEILGHPDLCYRSVDDAARKIIKVLTNEDMASQLRSHLAFRASLFTTKRYQQAIRDVVSGFLSDQTVTT